MSSFEKLKKECEHWSIGGLEIFPEFEVKKYLKDKVVLSRQDYELLIEIADKHGFYESLEKKLEGME